MSIKPTLLIITLLSIWTLCPMAVADRIILKDGTVEQSDRIWETDNYYHFILQGTKNVEIRFTKTIVDRIERESPVRSSEKANSHPATEVPSVEIIPVDKADNAKITRRGGDNHAVHPLRLPDESIIKENKGIAFYDPRRKDRYWVTRQSRHSTLNNAINAISELYGRSSQWVEDHLGEANDLGAIHGTLIGQIKSEQSQIKDSGTKASASVSNARRAESSIRKRHFSARDHSDDLRAPTGLPPAQIAKGVLFYDPRRSEKYWSSPKSRHNTLKEAIRALARQYQTSEAWIADHMGNTNDLAEIHRNIQQSIVRSLPPSN